MLAPPSPPTHEELEALIREARQRQMRRRLRAAAGVAVAAAAGFSIYALFGGGTARPSVTKPSSVAGAPLCRSPQLTASGEFNGAAGSIFGAVMIYNTSPAACSLPQMRPEVAIGSPGRQPPIEESRLNPSAAPLLQRGAMAEIYVEWANWCGKTPTSLTLRFGQSLHVTAPLVDTQPPCSDALHPSAPSQIADTRPLSAQ